MKKSLIALAALASTGAFAQSASMTITGGTVVDATALAGFHEIDLERGVMYRYS